MAAKAVLFLGPTGAGKSMSMRNMRGETTIVAKCIHKALPFPAREGWKKHIQPDRAQPPKQVGNVLEVMVNRVDKSFLRDLLWIIDTFGMDDSKDVLIIDDIQELFTAENAMKAGKKDDFGAKYNIMVSHFWEIQNHIAMLPAHKRVYFFAHNEEIEGENRMKTLGTKVYEKITPEGYFTYVVRVMKINGEHIFQLKGGDYDTVKMPVEVFGPGVETMENDLAKFDAVMVEYQQSEL